MHQIIGERYPSVDWNIYGAQASDGDNWADDSPRCHDILSTKLLPMLQYYTYIEITPKDHQALWHTYEDLPEQFPDNFAMRDIQSQEDIYPVFHELFHRRTS